MTVLQIVQAFCYESNIPAPTALAASTDPATLQLKHLLLSCGRELRKAKCWTTLKRSYSFTTSDGVATYALPDDFYASVLETYWDRTNKQPLAGPQTDAAMNRLLYGLVPSGSQTYFRIFGRPGASQIQVSPTPGATELTLSFDYLSSYWVLSSGSWREDIQADADTTAFDDDLLILGLKYKWYQHKGLEWQPFKQQWDEAIDAAKARWQGNRIVNLSTSGMGLYLNIPEGSYTV